MMTQSLSEEGKQKFTSFEKEASNILVHVTKTRGKFEVIEIDEDDYELFMSRKWHINSRGYVVHSENKTSSKIYLHALIMNTPSGLCTDHIDGDKLNNKKDNLRICSNTHNQWNRHSKVTGKSKFIGVHLEKRINRWKASIRHNGYKIFLGYFDKEEDAAIARDKKCKELRGELAILNFPETE